MGKSLSIMEWNINQATNRTGKNIIPDIVFDEIQRLDKDIVILSEFSDSCKNANEFKMKLENILGYDVRVSDNKDIGQNDVIAAWKKNKFDIVGDPYFPRAIGDIPELLIVHLKNKDTEFECLVVANRIKGCGNDKIAWEQRKRQMDTLLKIVLSYKPDIHNIIITGDFNNNRANYHDNWQSYPRDAFVPFWSLKVIDELAKAAGFNRYTPDGSSIWAENSKFPEDHFLVKGFESLVPKGISYSREFAINHPDVYLYGKDFQIYNKEIKRVTWTIPFGAGIPDHAVLEGQFLFE